MSKNYDANPFNERSPGNSDSAGALLRLRDTSNGPHFIYDGEASYVLKHENFVFSSTKTFECGQCFRFDRAEQGLYKGVLAGRFVSVDGYDGYAEVKVLEGPCGDSFASYLDYFFDVATDYRRLSYELSLKDDVMKDAVNASCGIRLLNQDFFETVISFILSANNNIPRIKKCIENLCRNYGKKIANGIFAFPEAEALSKCSGSEISELCKVGYRGPYIAETSKLFASGDMDYCNILKLSTNEKYKNILSLPGVGPKVLNCIMLFTGLDRSAFPVDVWVERMMNELYGLDITDRVKLEKYGRDYFGENAGLAQQYLFYYIRQIHGK